VRVVDRSPSVPHTRPLDDRSASPDESPDGGGPLIEMCGAIVDVSRQRILAWRRASPPHPGFLAFSAGGLWMLVGVWGGDGGGSGVAHSPWAHPRRPTATRAGGGHGPWVSSSPFGAATTFNEARARWFVLSEARCGSQWSFFCSLTIVHTVPSSDVGEAAGREEEGGRG